MVLRRVSELCRSENIALDCSVSFHCGKDDVKKVKQQVRMIQVLRTEAILVRC